MTPPLHRHAGLVGVNALFLAALLPFIAKPFHVDDPMYLWAAQQICATPLDPYGLSVNWYGMTQPMAEVMKNPPGVCYYLAAAALLLGWSEVAMHAALLLPALGLASGTYLLARRMCTQPFFAAAIAMLAPVTLVSATTVMSDVLMLCLYVWAIYLWTRGIDENRITLLIVACAFAAASALTKYFGATAILLMIAYALLRTRRAGWWIAALLIPVLVLAGYQWWTRAMYGRGLLLDAAQYATGFRESRAGGWLGGIVTALAFVGGCGATAALVMLLAARPRAWIITGAGAVALFAGLAVMKPFGAIAGATTLQLALFGACGAFLIAAVAQRWWIQRDADTTLLVLWIAGTLFFACFLNWSISARALLPLAPPIAILALRHAPPAPSLRSRFHPVWGLAIGGVLAFAAAAADMSLARTARLAADELARRSHDYPAGRWFLGHWGFQWYMERHGIQAVDGNGATLLPGDLIFIPQNNSNVLSLPRDRMEQIDALEILPIGWIATMDRRRVRAGFYSDVWGPLPFGFGAVPNELYVVMRVKQPMALYPRMKPL